ncbi:N-acetyltransferas-like protein 9 [Calycina marina]|uniref:N-acetyltransferas-like protein 9 n=1 Tax=Calycina marina TaxID=1763456 RepID=A0A9P7Z2B8_9HELO|nr:N-acetyltransferas-like protein 9 [Calycina marina]
MLANENTAILTSMVTLVPYEKSHVPTYHNWMKDPDIQEATASEPLSLEEEYSMQVSWRQDSDKLTFIACMPSRAPISDQETTLQAGKLDSPDQIIGDVNLFLTVADEDPEGCIGELELMIAPTSQQRQGYGRATVLTILNYIQRNLEGILAEFARKEGVESMSLLQLKAKIGGKNKKSIGLFESIGFIKVDESANYFGEFELILEGFLEEGRTRGLLEKFGVEGYREMRYSNE